MSGPDGPSPFVFLPFRMRSGRIPVPVMQLAYCRSVEDFVAAAAPLGRALALLHGDPAHPWTVEALGRRVGLSRSGLGQRFTALIGVPPMQYLARWRTSLAAQRLRETDAPIIRVANDVGYDSEAAFNRAFKREFGLPPAAWRKSQAR